MTRSPTTNTHLIGLTFAAAVTVGCGEGQLHSRPDGASKPDAALRCNLAATYTWNASTSSLSAYVGWDMLRYSSTLELTPPTAFDYQSAMTLLSTTATQTTSIACSPSLPACGDAALIDVSDIEAAISHPDVQAALAQASPPEYVLFATDSGSSQWFTRAGKQVFSISWGYCGIVGFDCNQTIPPGISALQDVLNGLASQQATDPSCSSTVSGTTGAGGTTGDAGTSGTGGTSGIGGSTTGSGGTTS